MSDRVVKFQIGEAFPAVDPVAKFVVRLAIIGNDLSLLDELIRGDLSEESDRRTGGAVSFLYIAASQLREAAKVLSRDIERPEIRAFLSKLEEPGQSMLERIQQSFEPWSGSFVETQLKKLRDVRFHYPNDEDMEHALTAAAPHHSDINFGSTGGEHSIRYNFARHVLVRLTDAGLGYTVEEMRQTVSKINRLMQDYLAFALLVVGKYLEGLPPGILDLSDLKDGPETRTG